MTLMKLATWDLPPVAIVPLRVQPLHIWHCNLLVDICRHFESVLVLVSTKHDSENNPYSFELRKKWLTDLQSECDIIFSVAPLPLFSSGMSQEKTTSDIATTKNEFTLLTQGQTFSIVSGNSFVVWLCREVYDFDVIEVWKEYKPDWHFDWISPFVDTANNGKLIRTSIVNHGLEGISTLVEQNKLPGWIKPTELMIWQN